MMRTTSPLNWISKSRKRPPIKAAVRRLQCPNGPVGGHSRIRLIAESSSPPFGPGVYELRHKAGRLVCPGKGSHTAFRMTSLLPAPLGEGTRNNVNKRAYVKEHLSDLEYRTFPCLTAQEAQDKERELKRRNGHNYVFPN